MSECATVNQIKVHIYFIIKLRENLFKSHALTLLTYGNDLIEAVKKRDSIAIKSFHYMQEKTKDLTF